MEGPKSCLLLFDPIVPVFVSAAATTIDGVHAEWKLTSRRKVSFPT